MKKKAKKPLFDPRLPGAKMIFYGAILLMIAGGINAFFSWVFVVGTYLGAVELLAEYPRAREDLRFVSDWLEENRNENGNWDMGKSVKDGVYIPLS
ncbi:MAG: hypothetical protein J6J07_01440, partial [Oscillospiraceae bacterium]|nr:hypothetical protein [Oscillospiraceae bacterium]